MSKKATPWYAIRRRTAMAAAVLGVVAAAEIYIYGDIGESWYEETVSAATFVKELNEIDATAITVRINSIGGSVPDGLAIYNALRRHKAEVTIEIDGMAFSIASLIAMAGDKVNMANNAMLMIHGPWTYVAGNSVELRELADQLDVWAAAMSTSYAARTGDQPAMLALLTDGKDHYYTAEQALAEKFVDAITDPMPVAASASRDLPLNRYRSLPAALQTVGILAAAAAPSQELSMSTPTSAANQTPAATPKDPAAVLAEDKARRGQIRASFQGFASREGVSALQLECEDDHGCTPEAAGLKLLAVLGKDASSVNGKNIVTLEDETDKARKGTTQALLARAGVVKAEGANPFRGFTLTELARASLTRAGYRSEGQDKKTFIGAAFTHGSSDFGSILANVAEKAMLKGYAEAAETFQLWTRAGELPDFKPGKRVDLNAFPSLREVAAGAEYKYASIGDRGETVLLATYGELFSINRQAIINDDLGAFTRIPQLMGRAAIRTIGDLVYAVLTSNQPMSDGVALFHADHGNLLSAGAISTATVDAMGAAMAKQKQGAATLNIAMQYLIVPRALKGLANVVRSSEFDVGADKKSSIPNSVRDSFEVIADARLDATSATAWYGAASSASNDTIEVSYLDGNQAPVLEQKDGWGVDGTEFKVRIDAGVAPLDFRTLAKNAG